jgi:hypothetical protein
VPSIRSLKEGVKVNKQCLRNINVAAINAGLVQGVFSLQPGANWWPLGESGAFYDFVFAPDIGAVCRVADIGFDELEFETLLCPDSFRLELLKRWQRNTLSWAKHCHAEAKGWLERRKGAWLQTSKPSSWNFRCRRKIILSVLAAAQQPLGYSDHGPVVW